MSQSGLKEKNQHQRRVSKWFAGCGRSTILPSCVVYLTRYQCTNVDRLKKNDGPLWFACCKSD
jgi:hypothetical protein